MSTTLQLPLNTHPSALENWEDKVDALFEEIFRPKADISVSECAELYRVLSSDNSAQPGPWRNDNTPYLVEIMDALADPDVTEMVIMKSARVGYTEGVIGNGILYFVAQAPCPIIVLQPAENDAEDWSKKQLAVMIRDSPALRDKFSEGAGRDAKNTILDKVFTGGSITVRGAHSPRGLRRLTAKVVFMDEVSAFQVSAGGSGDPVKLGETRTATYPDRKIVKGSTPLIRGQCRITKDFERSDQRYWHVPCPHCSHEQVLRWGTPETPYGIKWDREIRCHRCKTQMRSDQERCECGCAEFDVKHLPETAYYLCEGCAAPIEEHHKPAMVRAGYFKATNPESKVPGWHLCSLVSLISEKARWSNMVQEFLDSREDPELLQVFVNEALGEPWEEKAAKFSPEQLATRGELWVGIEGAPVDVPHGVGALVSFVDVQQDRLEVLIRGFGAGEESWGVLHHRIYRDPQTMEAWAQLEAIRTRPYVHQSGAIMRVQVMVVDAGYATDAVYGYVRSRESLGVYASVGRAGAGKPPVSRAAKANKDGVKVFTIGVDTLKDRLFSTLKLITPGPRYLHFPASDPDRFNGFDAEYFAQFGREKKIRKKGRGRVAGTHEYIKSGRNEAIDLEVGCIAAMHIGFSPATRQTLGARANEISKRGAAHREMTGLPAAKGRRIISRGIE